MTELCWVANHNIMSGEEPSEFRLARSWDRCAENALIKAGVPTQKINDDSPHCY
jgi:hypothetical protein